MEDRLEAVKLPDSVEKFRLLCATVKAQDLPSETGTACPVNSGEIKSRIPDMGIGEIDDAGDFPSLADNVRSSQVAVEKTLSLFIVVRGEKFRKDRLHSKLVRRGQLWQQFIFNPYAEFFPICLVSMVGQTGWCFDAMQLPEKESQFPGIFFCLFLDIPTECPPLNKFIADTYEASI